MNKDYSCPLCKSQKWKPVQEYVFRSGDHSSGKFPKNERLTGLSRVIRGFLRSLIYAAPRPFRIERKLLTTYERLRREVLFDLWFLGEEKIIITSQYCLNCGFMACSPRPSESDVTAKYMFLGDRSRPEEIEEYNSFLDHDKYSLENREQIYSLVTGSAEKETFHILDCGGASGWFVVPFAEKGCECDLADYETGQLPGINKVADDVREIEGEEIYDAIICRAVLEHMTDPLAMAGKFHDLLKNKGLVYAMVPCEIHVGIERLGYDPVTHINFFTPGSFETLFRLAGFEIASSGMDRMNNIWILARKTDKAEKEELSESRPDIERYLYPGRWETVKKYILVRLK